MIRKSYNLKLKILKLKIIYDLWLIHHAKRIMNGNNGFRHEW
ncbi:hypothetical protein SAMN04488688_113168 [Paenibacillus sp. cl141a]|nr:hypothetical protein SAMN04488688_113168 [Paenibacillus sp. cl141a]